MMDKRVPVSSKSTTSQNLGVWILSAAILHAVLSPTISYFFDKKAKADIAKQSAEFLQQLPSPEN